MNVLVTLFVLLFTGQILAAPLNNIVVFGDSLSDNGNLYEYMGGKLPQSPPYYRGRFTNGRVWVEHLAASCFPRHTNERLFDYAFGGACISGEQDDDVLFTLNRELDIYLSTHQDRADENSLFILWIGSNNYLALPEERDKAVAEVSNGIRHGLQRLVNAGAKHIMVVNAPDLGRIPLATKFETMEALSWLSLRHNEQLLDSVNALQQANPEVQWFYFDVGSKFKELLDNPKRFGFNDITSACYDAAIEKNTPKLALHIASAVKAGATDASCKGHVFFDPVHPTAQVHKIMGEQARMILDAAGVEFNDND